MIEAYCRKMKVCATVVVMLMLSLVSATAFGGWLRQICLSAQIHRTG